MCRWYKFNFRINSPNIQNPKVWVDIFIIDKIVRDVINDKKSQIVLWTIHRRWKDDQYGHELTFACYTDEKTACWIEEFINENEFYKVLQTNNLIVGGTKVPKNEKGTNIRDIADDESTRDWTEELKESWPYYINGCCEMLLCLIKNIKGGKNEPYDIQSAEQFYTQVNNEIIKVWQYFGCRAFFHHINAIFGYQPLLIQPQFWADF